MVSKKEARQEALRRIRNDGGTVKHRWFGRGGARPPSRFVDEVRADMRKRKKR